MLLEDMLRIRRALEAAENFLGPPECAPSLTEECWELYRAIESMSEEYGNLLASYTRILHEKTLAEQVCRDALYSQEDREKLLAKIKHGIETRNT